MTDDVKSAQCGLSNNIKSISFNSSAWTQDLTATNIENLEYSFTKYIKKKISIQVLNTISLYDDLSYLNFMWAAKCLGMCILHTFNFVTMCSKWGDRSIILKWWWWFEGWITLLMKWIWELFKFILHMWIVWVEYDLYCYDKHLNFIIF